MTRIKPEPMLKPKEIVIFPREEPREERERPRVKLLHEIRRYHLA